MVSRVFLVDGDMSARRGLARLLRTAGHDVRDFASANELLDSLHPETSGCLVLDIRLPGMSGLELQETLAARGNSMPVIFVTGHGDIPMAVEAMRNGAVDFIQKPFRDQELLDRIGAALRTDESRRSLIEETTKIQARIGRLTKREHEVLDLVVTGKPNKIVAYELGVSQRTVEIHRARVMEKMEAQSLADLVRMHLSS